MPDYTTHYVLTALLDNDPTLIPSPDICTEDAEILYAAAMDRLAQPLPDGTISPFSGRNPLSASGQLISTIVYLLALHGHECNLIPNLVWLQNLRLQGVTLRQATYPLITLEFTRSPLNSTDIRPPILIPQGTKVFSRLSNDLNVITTQDVTLTEDTVQSLSRLNVLGKNTNLTAEEFSGNCNITGIQSVAGVEVISYGADIEGMEAAVLRARLNTQLQNRVVTARDWYQFCLDLGCQKVNILPGVDPDSEGEFADFVLVVVYPSSLTVLVQQSLLELQSIDTRTKVIPPTIVQVTGSVTVRATPNLTTAQAIAQCNLALNTSINPPYGVWGDLNLEINLATALEKTVGIFAMTATDLYATTDPTIAPIPLNQWQPKPWHLFNLSINWIVLP